MVKDLWLVDRRVFTVDMGCRSILYPGGLGQDKRGNVVLHQIRRVGAIKALV